MIEAESDVYASTLNNSMEEFPDRESGNEDEAQGLHQGGEDPDPIIRKKRNAVKKMMRHAWTNYVKFAWPHNELKPISRKGMEGIFGRGMKGASIVDALDTLYIMEMDKEFNKAREWIVDNLEISDLDTSISVFETSIRYIGGLLSTYTFTGDSALRDKAVQVANTLLPAFNTPTGIPFGWVNLHTKKGWNFGWSGSGSSILADFGTLHMEFSYLSDVTGDPVYREKVEQIRTFLQASTRPSKLYPSFVNPTSGRWSGSVSVGAYGDSFYEYLLKEWIRSGKTDTTAKKMFLAAAQDINELLVQTSKGAGLTYIVAMENGRLNKKMDHLTCFAGGLFGLAGQLLNSSRFAQLGEEITETCHQSYARSATGLAPDIFQYSETKDVEASSTKYILRPETFESYFVMWRITKDPKYRDWGWDAVLAIERNCRTGTGYSGIRNVNIVDGEQDDEQQTFFLAETLKYLYLLFSDDQLLSLDEWVLNTEAHPLPIWGVNPLYRYHNQSI